jgi:hypothetical protein
LCRRRPSAQLRLCRRQSCADGDLACLPHLHVVPTAPINCRRHSSWPSAPCFFPVVSYCYSHSACSAGA